MRHGSLSIGFNVSVSLFGGTTPLVVTALIGATGDMMMPACSMRAAAVIGGFAVWRMAESAGRPLPGIGGHPRLSSTAIQTVGAKDYDGFALARVVA